MCVRARIRACDARQSVTHTHTQPVEGPLAPALSTGLADYSHWWIQISDYRSVLSEAETRSHVWTVTRSSATKTLSPPVHTYSPDRTDRPPSGFCSLSGVTSAGPPQF